MKVGSRVLSVLALLLVVAPVGVGAVELSRDDGSFETNEALPPGVTRAVDFELPTGALHDLTHVSLFIINGGPRTLSLGITVWDALLARVYSAPVTVNYTAPGWYVVDLAPAGITASGSLRVGVSQSVVSSAPFLGRDMTPPAGHTWQYTASPVPAWMPLPGFDSGIRVTVEPVVEEAPPAPAVPVLACEGFASPLHKPRAMRRGGRTLPLKATLADADGFPVGAEELATAPVVQVLFTPAGGGDVLDVTEAAAPAGRSGAGTSFRFTDEGWWRYNLRTRGFAEAGTYEILLVSGEPAEYVVDPPCGALVEVGGGKARKARGLRR